MSSLLAEDKEFVLEKMYFMSVTLEVSKFSGWSNADAEWNMPYISVTLDVSKLTGWLNAFAYCRVERRACDVGSEVCGPDGAGARACGAALGASAARTRSDRDWRTGRQGSERT